MLMHITFSYIISTNKIYNTRFWKAVVKYCAYENINGLIMNWCRVTLTLKNADHVNYSVHVVQASGTIFQNYKIMWKVKEGINALLM